VWARTLDWVLLNFNFRFANQMQLPRTVGRH
jgi:hypothetical protein